MSLETEDPCDQELSEDDESDRDRETLEVTVKVSHFVPASSPLVMSAIAMISPIGVGSKSATTNTTSPSVM